VNSSIQKYRIVTTEQSHRSTRRPPTKSADPPCRRLPRVSRGVSGGHGEGYYALHLVRSSPLTPPLGLPYGAHPNPSGDDGRRLNPRQLSLCRRRDSAGQSEDSRSENRGGGGEGRGAKARGRLELWERRAVRRWDELLFGWGGNNAGPRLCRAHLRDPPSRLILRPPPRTAHQQPTCGSGDRPGPPGGEVAGG
jgi:hypothetical protein